MRQIGVGRIVTRARVSVALFVAMVLMAAAVFMRPAFAVQNTGKFQLDGDASTATITAGTFAGDDDWDKVCYQVAISQGVAPADATAQCSASSPTSGATAVSWVAELHPNSTFFTGGGSKDPEDIDKWLWKDETGGLPDKDNLEHAYAARYSLPPSVSCPSGGASTCEVIYFGADRFDNSGDAHQAFWFLQNKVELTNTKSGGGFKFSGVHRPGDLLVISNFSNGGTTSTIFVYKWDPTCTSGKVGDADSCDAANLRLLADLSGPEARCDTATPGTQACGIVNPVTITMPWTFTDKSATSGNGALQGEFFEAGINLSLLGLADECFSTVVAESRASTSPTATLKDFVIGSFGTCGSSITTTPVPNTDVFPGTSVRDSAVLNISGTSTWSGSLAFHLCGPSQLTPANTGTCQTGGTPISTHAITQATAQPILSDATTVTTLGRHCWRAEFTSTTNGVPNSSDSSANECFNVVQLQPTISTTQTYTVKDSATIAVATGAGNLTGTVRFRLFPAANCSGTALVDQSLPVSGASPQTVETTPVTLTTPAGGVTNLTLAWLVEYTSTNAGHNHVTSACNVEGATLSVDNQN